MKIINIELKLYKYDELNEKAKAKAFEEHLDFLSSFPYEYEDEDEKGNIIKKEECILDWNDEELKEYVEDSILVNSYWFFENGEKAHTTHFTGKHEKAGTTELYLNGKTYILEVEK